MTISVSRGIGCAGLFFLVLSTLVLCACDSAIVPPHLNPHPTKSVTIRVFAPPSLKIQLNEAWEPNSHPFFSSGACNLPGGMRTHLYVAVILKWDGTSYVGSFLEDRYLPSRCDWSFGGVFATSPSLGTTVIYSDMLSAAYPVLNDSDRSGEMWCGIDPGPKQLRIEVCTALDYFAKYSDHFPQPWRAAAVAAVAPGNFRFNQGVLFITPNAKSIELHYHDYDAEARAENGHQ
jgi:hypothetical protein